MTCRSQIRLEDTLIYQYVQEELDELVEEGKIAVIHQSECASTLGGVCNCEREYRNITD